jgi:hypothetical protein
MLQCGGANCSVMVVPANNARCAVISTRRPGKDSSPLARSSMVDERSGRCRSRAWRALNQPTRTISAKPRASLRSDLFGRTDRTAWACRASRQTTGRPSANNVWVSHTDVGPLSRPTRTTSRACLRIRRAMALGSDATLPSKTHVPCWFRTQTKAVQRYGIARTSSRLSMPARAAR